MPKEMVLDFSKTEGELRKTRRKQVAIHRWHDVRYRHWIKKGYPPEIARWLAKEGFPIYPKTTAGKEAQKRLNMYLREMKEDIKEFREEGLSRAQATRKFLNLLKAKNKRYGRESYNFFTFGS